jgi:hypothetical protein
MIQLKALAKPMEDIEEDEDATRIATDPDIDTFSRVGSRQLSRESVHMAYIHCVHSLGRRILDPLAPTHLYLFLCGCSSSLLSFLSSVV